MHGGVGRAHAENALELRRSLGKLPLRNQDATNQLFGGNDVAVLRFSGQSPQLHERFVKLSFKEKLRTQRKARPRIVEHRLPQLDHRLVVISGRNQFRRQLGAGTPVRAPLDSRPPQRERRLVLRVSVDRPRRQGDQDGGHRGRSKQRDRARRLPRWCGETVPR